MEWLAQNWIWIAFVVGVLLPMRRGGMGCGKGLGGHTHHQSHESTDQLRKTDQNGSPTDPVSGERVSPDGAVNVTYKGRLYYFASQENRATFEATPDKYATVAGLDEVHRHHRHGC